MKKLSLLLASLLAILSVNSISIRNSAVHFNLEFGIELAEARRGGGRSRGGSFSRPSRSSPSRSRGSGGSSGGSRPSRSTPSRTTPRSTPRSTPQSTPTPSSGGGSTGGRVRGGSFTTPTPAPAPTPDSRPGTAPTRVPGRTTPAPTAPPTAPRADSYRDEPPARVERSRSFFFVPLPGGGGGGSTGSSVQNQGSQVQGETQGSQQEGQLTQDAQTRSQGSRSGGSGGFLLLLILVIGAGILMWWFLSRRRSDAAGESQLTVTKLQVGLLAQARELQSRLTELSLEADLASSEGLKEFLQECSLSLLSHPDYWTHAQGESQCFASSQEAQKAFERFSIQERSKFSEETLSNVGGRIRERSADVDEDSDPGEYIVVTFLVATRESEPPFETISAAEDLQSALQCLAAVPTESLLVFELLWTPQAETDSLTADDLLSYYPDLVIL
ncbi:MAG: DUF1517 domain-containing protein, partial [Phormidium sp.]